MPSARGESARASGLSCQAARTRRRALAAMNRETAAGETSPAGRARLAVRGLAASIFRSISRFHPMAALRAPTMATTIQSTVRQTGQPWAASIIPRKANGRAKIVCSNLIISSTVFRVRRGRAARVVMAAPSYQGAQVGGSAARPQLGDQPGRGEACPGAALVVAPESGDLETVGQRPAPQLAQRPEPRREARLGLEAVADPVLEACVALAVVRVAVPDLVHPEMISARSAVPHQPFRRRGLPPGRGREPEGVEKEPAARGEVTG